METIEELERIVRRSRPTVRDVEIEEDGIHIRDGRLYVPWRGVEDGKVFYSYMSKVI